MGKNEVKYKAVMTRDELVGYLEELTKTLKEGNICIQKSDEQIVLHPTEQVKVEIEASEKKGKSKFELELTWGGDVTSDAPLIITNKPAAHESSESSGQQHEETTSDESTKSVDQDDAAGADDGDQEKNGYKKLKKRMKSAFKEITASLEKQDMPDMNLIDDFFNMCREMTTFEGKGDEHYQRFNAQAYDMLGAAQSGDLAAMAASIEALRQIKDACHEQYK
jgi:XXXCH domain-containing protein